VNEYANEWESERLDRRGCGDAEHQEGCNLSASERSKYKEHKVRKHRPSFGTRSVSRLDFVLQVVAKKAHMRIIKHTWDDLGYNNS